MTISTPTTAGQILTSAYVNNNINSGLVYIDSGTISTQSSKQIDNCFTSTYDNYHINITISAVSTTAVLYLQMVDGTTPDASANYYGNMIQRSQGGVVTNDDVGSGTQWTINSWSNFGSVCMNTFDVMNPKLATTTAIAGDGMTNAATFVNTTQIGGGLLTNTQYEGLIITASAGTFSGVITVFGYRKA